MIVKAVLVGVGYCLGSIVEAQVYELVRIQRMIRKNHEASAALTQAAAAMQQLQEGFEVWMETEEAKGIMKQLREEQAREEQAEHQAATS